jgi:hypothetical protein
MIDIIYWFPVVPTILTQSSDVNLIPPKNSNNTSQMTAILAYTTVSIEKLIKYTTK